MGTLTAIQIRNFKEPGRYSDGEGLILNLISPGRGSWMVRVQANGKRRDIGLGALADIGLGEAREATRKIRKDPRFQELVRDLDLFRFWHRHGPPDGHAIENDRLICL